MCDPAGSGGLQVSLTFTSFLIMMVSREMAVEIGVMENSEVQDDRSYEEEDGL